MTGTGRDKEKLEAYDPKIGGGIDSAAVGFDSFWGAVTQVRDGVTASAAINVHFVLLYRSSDTGGRVRSRVLDRPTYSVSVLRVCRRRGCEPGTSKNLMMEASK